MLRWAVRVGGSFGAPDSQSGVTMSNKDTDEFRRDGSRKYPNCDCGAILRGHNPGNVCAKCGCVACKKCCKVRKSTGQIMCEACLPAM